MPRRTKAAAEQIPSSVNLSFHEYAFFHRLKKGIIRIDMEINEDLCTSLLDEIELFRDIVPGKKLTVSINSPGGYAYDALAIYDKLMELRKDGYVITGEVAGLAASAAAAIILQACDRRVALANATLMLHEVSNRFEGKNAEIKDDAKETDRLNDKMIAILAKRMKKTPAEVKAIIERKEVWLSPEKALEIRLIDEIR